MSILTLLPEGPKQAGQAEPGDYAERGEEMLKDKSGRVPFSPEAALWIRRTQVYQSLLRYHRGLIRNRGNLKRMARRCRILQCFSIPIKDILQRIKVCIEQCDYFWKHGQQYWRKHLYKCLQNAKDAEDNAKEKETLAIIQREKD